MLAIDIPTVFAFSTLLSEALGLLLLWLWWRDRSELALASWGAGRLIAGIGLSLLAMRGHIPVWASIELAVALICLGYGTVWCGARQFEGRRAGWRRLSAGAAVWLIACQSSAFLAWPQARLTLLGLIVASYCVAAGLEFIRGQRRSPLPSRPLVSTMMFGIAALYGIFGPLGLLFPLSQTGNSLPSSFWFGLIASIGLTLVAGTSILLVALTKEQAELRTTTALAAARDAAAAASDQKTQFLARMSHEIRTPLNGMLGLAQVLANDPHLGLRARMQAATLEQAGQHLLAILNEGLDLARIESGHLQLSPAPLGLRDFLGRTLAFVEGNAASKRIALTLRLSPNLPETVLADAVRLRQILLNLLNNALKFTPPGGSVTLEAGTFAAGTVRFLVTDTGPGVPASLRTHLFQPYARADSEGPPSGSGLGLAISARLARAMSGILTHMDGAGGVGSWFALQVPLPATDAGWSVGYSGSNAPTVRKGPIRTLRILVVDDISLNRMTARALLEHAGHTVEEAAGGYAALAAIMDGPLPDVVLMDVSMPGMDGYTTVRRIRSMDGPARGLAVLAVTANALPGEIAASLAAGMDGHVVKPIELQALLTAIASAMDRAATRQIAVRAPAGSGVAWPEHSRAAAG